MTPANAHLTLRPDRCNHCGRCVEACPYSAVRVGVDYILVDWHACNQCCACVKVCDRNAICREVVATRSTATIGVAPTDVGKVVVGSRAEAKAVRKAAKQAAKQAFRPSVQTGGTAAAIADASAVVAEPAASPSAPARAAGSSARRARWAAPIEGADLAIGDVSWTLVDAGALLAMLLLTIVGKNAVLAIPAMSLMPAAWSVAARTFVLAIYYALQLGMLGFLAGRHNSGLARGFGLRSPDETDDAEGTAHDRPSGIGSAALVVALLVAVEGFAIVYGLAAQSIGWGRQAGSSSDVVSVFGSGVAGAALSVLLVALVAPVAEELAFRGVVLLACGRKWGMWPAIGISSVLFAVYHMNGWLFLPMLGLGAALGWLTWTRRSLWPSIALHVFYNGLAVAAAFLVPK